MKTTQNNHIRPIDQTVLELLRQADEGWTIPELTAELGVTATAVRQRVDRLVEMELVGREKEGAGRGRPSYRYFLTKSGFRFASASYADLAAVLWEEILSLPDADYRAEVLHRVARRLGTELRQSVPDSASLSERLAAAASALKKRQVLAVVNQSNHLPVLEVQACPYPELSSSDGDRTFCEVEQEMISEAVGQSVQLECCRLDGHELCQFRPVPAEQSS